MKTTLRNLIETHAEVIPYLVFGVLTTVVNILSYWVLAHGLLVSVMASTILAWILSVLFAYVTNRTWVFHSAAKGLKAIGVEIVSFFLGRLLTGILDWGIMYVCVDWLQLDDMVVKTTANIIVIVLNYLVSKFLVFRRKGNIKEQGE